MRYRCSVPPLICPVGPLQRQRAIPCLWSATGSRVCVSSSITRKFVVAETQTHTQIHTHTHTPNTRQQSQISRTQIKHNNTSESAHALHHSHMCSLYSTRTHAHTHTPLMMLLSGAAADDDDDDRGVQKIAIRSRRFTRADKTDKHAHTNAVRTHCETAVAGRRGPPLGTRDEKTRALAVRVTLCRFPACN